MKSENLGVTDRTELDAQEEVDLNTNFRSAPKRNSELGNIQNKMETSTEDKTIGGRGILFREAATLDEGKSFGELALIVHKPRMATVKCEQTTHFAILSKHDFQKSLGKIEKKHLNKMIDFLKDVECFKNWTRNSIGKYFYF